MDKKILINDNIYTLNKNFILRKSNKECSIYDIRTDNKYVIDNYIFVLLKIFQLKCISLHQLEDYFKKNNFANQINLLIDHINTRSELNDLLIEASVPCKEKDIYSIIPTNSSQFYEFTPENIDLLITNKCNLKCPHCYRNSMVSDELKRINMERMRQFIDEMEELNVYRFKITGGEPFLHPDLFEIVEYAAHKPMCISILTNGTIPMDEKWLSLLEKVNILLGISLDGATAETNDIIRGNGSFNKTINNLEKFSKRGIKYSITFTVNLLNKNEIREMLNLVENKFKNGKIAINFVEKSGRAKNENEIFALSKLEIETIKQEIEAILQQYPDLNVKIVDNNQLETTEKELSLLKEKGDVIFCKAGHSMLAIDSSLTVYPCIYGIGGKKEYPVGNLLDDSLINIWNNASRLDIFRGTLKITDLPVCNNCNLKNICNLKYCRLRPLYAGMNFTDPVSFCNKMV
jgi:radical SAM protein with 4Fe4S-binding SPASM domain